MLESVLERLVGRLGRTLEYAHNEIIEPANPAKERAAKVETEWIEFDGFVGNPRLLPGEVDPMKMYPNKIVVHTLQVLAADALVRYAEREYRIDNVSLDPEHGVGYRRYEMTANLSVVNV